MHGDLPLPHKFRSGQILAVTRPGVALLFRAACPGGTLTCAPRLEIIDTRVSPDNGRFMLLVYEPRNDRAGVNGTLQIVTAIERHVEWLTAAIN